MALVVRHVKVHVGEGIAAEHGKPLKSTKTLQASTNVFTLAKKHSHDGIDTRMTKNSKEELGAHVCVAYTGFYVKRSA